MHKKDLDRIIQRYNKRLEKHGGTIDTMASGTKERRNIRFKILKEVGIKDGDSILDLGCGFGDFTDYLDRNNLDVEYTGYDINPSLIEVAREKYPTRNFEVKDVLSEDFPTFDFIVSSSCFNLPLRHQNNYDFIEDILKTCYAHAVKGVSVDFLSSFVDFKSEEGFHYDPSNVFNIAKSITKRVQLRHDYPLFEFNIYLYKDFKGWSL